MIYERDPNEAGTIVDIKKAEELVARAMEEEALKESSRPTELKLDSSNKVAFPGFPYTFEAVNEQILISIDIFKSGYECKTCNGKRKIEVKQGREAAEIKCPDCNGLGAKIILLPDSKKLMQTGVVVSMGTKAKELAEFKIGDRVLFGVHAGSMIPTKAGLMFKRMDWYQVWLKIEGAGELDAFDFIIEE
jgi:hypothetical protein